MAQRGRAQAEATTPPLVTSARAFATASDPSQLSHLRSQQRARALCCFCVVFAFLAYYAVRSSRKWFWRPKGHIRNGGKGGAFATPDSLVMEELFSFLYFP